MREVKLTAMAVLLLFGASALMAADMEKMAQKTVKGTVEMACPQGKMLKVSACTPCGSETKTVTLEVMSKCPKAAALQEQIQGLKAGSEVTVTYFTCPKTGKMFVTGIK
jgi:predicted Zn-ribbon and HTH transcriptional regulator